jgi:hypothetical protein
VRRSIILTAAGVGLCASGAFAADLSITGSLNQTFDVSDNYFLVNSPSGATLKSLSQLNLDFLARMPTTVYALNTYYSYYKYLGPGAEDTQLTSGQPAGATFKINHNDKLTKYNFDASWSRSEVAAVQLQESGQATVTGSVNTYNVNGGVSRDLSRTDSISWTAHASTVSFTAPNQTPYVDVSSQAAWNHSLSQLTALTGSVNFDWFSEDNTAHSQRLFWTILMGMQTRLSQRLTFNAQAGLAFVNAYQNGNVPSVNQSGITTLGITTLQAGAANGHVFNAGLTYQLLPTWSVAVNGGQSFTPTILGNIQQSTFAGFNVHHDVNHHSDLGFSANFSHLTANGIESDFFSASANYGYRFTRDLRANFTYTYRQRNDESGLARANDFLVSLTYDFTALPP